MGFLDFLNATTNFAYLLLVVMFFILAVWFAVWSFRFFKTKKETIGIVEPSEQELSQTLSQTVAGLEYLSVPKPPKKKEVKHRVEKVVVTEKVVVKELEDTKFKSFRILKTTSIFSFQHWKDWFLDKYFPAKVILINMELNNGFHRLFMVKEKDDGFVFRHKKYLFDDESKYYNIDAKLYVFDFHESIVLPVKRKIPVTSIKKVLESTEGIDIEYAINPSTLQRFMTAKIAEGVMKGTQMDEFMRKLQMFLIVTMIAVLVHFALFLYASGILQNINLPI